MRLKIAFACALFAFTGTTLFAQASGTFTIHTNGVIVTQEITPSTKVWTSTGTTTAQINGVAITGLTFSAYGQTTPGEFRVWGVLVGTLANGDQVTFTYQRIAPMRNGVTLASTMTYKIVGGTGVAKGITGSGTCKPPAPTPSGVSDYPCVGAYAIP